MKSVTDPHAVPAVVRTFAQGNERDQAAAVQLLGQIDIPSSTHALLRLAVFSASAAVRSAATEALLRREPRDFAGWLIDQIRTPWQYHVQPVGGPGSPGALQIVAPRFTMLRTYDAPPAFTVSDQFFGYVGYDVNGLPVVVRGAEMNSMAKLAALDARAPSGKLQQIEVRTQMLLAEANLKAVDSQQRLIADVNDVEAANAEALVLNQRITPSLDDDSRRSRPEERRGRVENVVVRPSRLPLRPAATGRDSPSTHRRSTNRRESIAASSRELPCARSTAIGPSRAFALVTGC